MSRKWLNFRTYYKSIQILQKCNNARILQYFATKFCDVTNFKMFILAVVMDFVLPAKQARSQLDNWGGGGAHIHIFVFCTLVSFEIDCFYGLLTRIHEYVPPPNYRASYGPAAKVKIYNIAAITT